MNPEAFDRLARALGMAVSRRRALGLVGAAVGGGLLAGAGRGGSGLLAQESVSIATPVPVPTAPVEVPMNQCTDFVLSGGPSVDDPIAVDDDLTVYLNDHEIFQDHDGTISILPPIPFQADNGDRLTVVARDVAACGRSIGPLWLHCADGAGSRFLTGGTDDGCIEDSPVPANFYRESWRI